ncbi:formate--tetrahydrofolate ligase [mine drainage metagenome]|uniref:Formate--tetrahydrofolate ligase n=1 Tax=mine drainage metagenome TaxID=410659 RepID=A0A1J5QHJ0_9ZZZZ
MPDLDVMRNARLLPVAEIAARLGIPLKCIEPYGRFKAKISAPDNAGKPGKLILVTATSPTPAGEGKTTTTIGLTDALNRIGMKAVAALREPSLGPCFGLKGGATGGGQAQVAPMEDINLHLTGDFHAVTAAHNLLSALIDNHLHHGNELGINPESIVWPRVLDINDRALRHVVTGQGPGNGPPREDRFDITVASEVMAILCLANDIHDLKERLGRILVGYTHAGEEVHAADLKAHGAMTALLKDAIKPNLLQTLENSPVIVHGGPFANIAHGCNSVIATRAALQMADYVVTEAGFGADLGAEKFIDIKCRKSGLKPDAVVLVTTIRALKYHGGEALSSLAEENLPALDKGLPNLLRHLGNLQTHFGLPVVVAINRFDSDSQREIEHLLAIVAQAGAEVCLCTHWKNGGEGAVDLAHSVLKTIEQGRTDFRLLYSDEMSLVDKIRTVARKIYGAADISMSARVDGELQQLQQRYGHFPVCIAKTQYSFSADKELLGAPSGHILPVAEIRLSRGAGFLVVVCGDIMTMPGLPRHPASENIDIDADGEIVGLR